MNDARKYAKIGPFRCFRASTILGNNNIYIYKCIYNNYIYIHQPLKHVKKHVCGKAPKKHVLWEVTFQYAYGDTIGVYLYIKYVYIYIYININI